MISTFYSYDPYVIFDDEDTIPMDVIFDDMPDPSLDTTEGETLLLGVSQYS
jgi:hypothetical protein